MHVSRTTFARRVFLIAGVYGVAVLVPQYFLEARIGRDLPPEITHPEFYYGFVGVALAWQVLYLLVGSDPVRFRPVMLVGVLGKLSFFIAVLALVILGRTAIPILAAASIDFVLALLFAIAYVKTRAA